MKETGLSKIELSLIALLLIFSTVVILNSVINRTQKITPNMGLEVFIGNDKIIGGTSSIINLTNDNSFIFSYSLDEKISNPYITFTILLPEEYSDIEWFDNISFMAQVKGLDRTQYKVFIMNNEGNQVFPDLKRYNESYFFAETRELLITIPRNTFKVPSWWLNRYNIDTLDSIPQFDNTYAIEFTTGSLSGNETAELTIDGITLSGSWLNQMLLYKILIIYAVLMIIFISSFRYYYLRKELILNKQKNRLMNDINKSLQMKNREIKNIAYTDDLTGIINRAGVSEKILFALESRENHNIPFSIILLDIDDFKRINDTKGHLAGDEALIKLVQLLCNNIRISDTLCRWGGEEFFILALNTDETSAFNLAVKIRLAIEYSDLGFTCSFGVAEEKDKEFEDIFRAADKALYKAKYSGKNMVMSASLFSEN